MNSQILRTILLVAIVACSVQSNAAEYPVALRWWGGPTVSVESYWFEPVVIDPTSESSKQLSEAELVLYSAVPPEERKSVSTKVKHTESLWLKDDSYVRIIKTLYRFPNEDQSTWTDSLKLNGTAGDYSHALTAFNPGWSPVRHESYYPLPTPTVMHVDGVSIVHWHGVGAEERTRAELNACLKKDALILPVGAFGKNKVEEISQLLHLLTPRYVLLLPSGDSTAEQVAALRKVLAEKNKFEIVEAIGNTLALSRHEGEEPQKTRLLALKSTPWEPKGELATMFEKMETACSASQDVFRPLSAKQMSFRPANGTHTPRWNAEHMMGRELLFFTQIYSKLDSEISPIDLNPKQMPDDYEEAHPDWTGAEEARQMQRVSNLVRRFGYLLEGLPLTGQAPGSRWKLDRLFAQMQRHYGEHTANVQKKFELDGWPAE